MHSKIFNFCLCRCPIRTVAMALSVGEVHLTHNLRVICVYFDWVLSSIKAQLSRSGEISLKLKLFRSNLPDFLAATNAEIKQDTSWFRLANFNFMSSLSCSACFQIENRKFNFTSYQNLLIIIKVPSNHGEFLNRSVLNIEPWIWLNNNFWIKISKLNKKKILFLNLQFCCWNCLPSIWSGHLFHKEYV